MGKQTGFLEYDRKNYNKKDVDERIKNFNDFVVDLNKEELQIQAARCMDCGIPFCHSGTKIGKDFIGCPLSNLIPETNDLVYRGLYKEAYKRLILTSNFPEFTGRVCPALCEGSCTVGLNMEPVTVKQLEKHVVEVAFEKGYVKPRINNKQVGKNVAVIGSGPSGLAAADDLNQAGFDVTVYEKSNRAGGLMMYGIPQMKLEKSIIERRLDILKSEGIEFIFNTCVGKGKDINPEFLSTQYDIIVLACGTEIARDLPLTGRNLKGIHFAVEYLTGVTKHVLGDDVEYINTKGKKVVIIGGGDTGNDCVGTAVRQGAESIVQLEIMPKTSKERTASNPWPLFPKLYKQDYGQEEAQYVYGKDPRQYLVNTKEFIGVDGVLNQIKIVDVEWKKVNDNFVLNELLETEQILDADYVFLAMGFIGANEEIFTDFNVVSTGNRKTNEDNIYICGDMQMGQSLVVTAINDGKLVANDIIKKFG